MAEAARSIAATGARPLAITDCLNFGNPEKPEVMAQFEAAVRGIADACRALGVPVVSGNVSLYNETDGRAIPPTPTVGMVGLMEDVEKHVRVAFRRSPATSSALLGETRDELGASEFLRTIRGRDEGPCPEVDLDAEKRLVDLLATLAERSLARLRPRHLRRRPRRRARPSARCRADSAPRSSSTPPPARARCFSASRTGRA